MDSKTRRLAYWRGFSFTLIELLVVITIIAVMVALLMPALKEAKEGANWVKCMSNQRQIGLAFTMYGEQYGRYPFSREIVLANAHWTTRITPFLTRFTNSTWAGGGAGTRSPVLICPSRGRHTTNLEPSYSANRQFLGSDTVLTSQYPRQYPYTSRPQEVILVADASLGTLIESSAHFDYPIDFKQAFNPATANTPVYGPDNVDAYNGGTWGNIRFRHRSNTKANAVFVDGHVEAIHVNQLYERYVKLDAPVTAW
jgi:prepilin-type processing-associated H-X9-DG protein